MDCAQKVYEIVQKIPKGKVATYGAVAKMAGTSPRVVGQVLHRNPDPEDIPCHRVVDRNGKIAENFAYGGWRGQRKKLIEEGVAFRDGMHVDLFYITRSSTPGTSTVSAQSNRRSDSRRSTLSTSRRVDLRP